MFSPQNGLLKQILFYLPTTIKSQEKKNKKFFEGQTDIEIK
jgi:hypothetical protein